MAGRLGDQFRPCPCHPTLCAQRGRGVLRAVIGHPAYKAVVPKTVEVQTTLGLPLAGKNPWKTSTSGRTSTACQVCHKALEPVHHRSTYPLELPEMHLVYASFFLSGGIRGV